MESLSIYIFIGHEFVCDYPSKICAGILEVDFTTGTADVQNINILLLSYMYQPHRFSNDSDFNRWNLNVFLFFIKCLQISTHFPSGLVVRLQ